MSAAHHVRNVLVRNTENETDVRTIEIKADSEGRFYAKEGDGFAARAAARAAAWAAAMDAARAAQAAWLRAAVPNPFLPATVEAAP